MATAAAVAVVLVVVVVGSGTHHQQKRSVSTLSSAPAKESAPMHVNTCPCIGNVHNVYLCGLVCVDLFV